MKTFRFWGFQYLSLPKNVYATGVESNMPLFFCSLFIVKIIENHLKYIFYDCFVVKTHFQCVLSVLSDACEYTVSKCR